MILRALDRLDTWLVLRVFMPIAHWVDYRWHINQYDLAAKVMTAGLALCVALNAEEAIKNWHHGWLNVISAGSCVWVYSHQLRDLQKASKAYERNPCAIPREAIGFIAMWPLRMLLLFLGLFLLCIEGLADTILHRWPWDAVVNSWMLLIAIGWYLAGGLPPWRARKKKERRSPWVAPLLAGVKSR